MTSKTNGVQFRPLASDSPQQMSWTDPAHHNAWLVRPNPDGSVTSISENMFGNVSPQPSSPDPDGYAALAYWAQQEGCGNVKKLDASCSAVWGALRLWHDANQNGVADPGELETLDGAGITGISLDDHLSKYADQYGNLFQYWAPISDSSGKGDHRSYDVFLLIM